MKWQRTGVRGRIRTSASANRGISKRTRIASVSDHRNLLSTRFRSCVQRPPWLGRHQIETRNPRFEIRANALARTPHDSFGE